MANNSKTIVLFIFLGLGILAAASWFFYALFLSLSIGSQASPADLADLNDETALNGQFQTEITWSTAELLTELAEPAALALGGQELIVASSGGRLVVFDLDTNDITDWELLTADQSIIDITVSPAWPADRSVFILSIDLTNQDQTMALSRWQLNDETKPSTVILDQIPAGSDPHGEIAVGPRGFLWLATADAGQPANAQNYESLAGKIIRLGQDGQIPADNPISGLPIWSVGWHQPASLYWTPTGELRVLDMASGRFSRLSLAAADSNGGWPLEDNCYYDQTKFTEPLWCQPGSGDLITALKPWPKSQASEPTSQADWLAATADHQLKLIKSEAGNITTEAMIFESTAIADLAVDSTGIIYVLTADGRLLQVASDN